MKHDDLHEVSSIPIYGTLIVVFVMVLFTLTEAVMAWVWVLSVCTVFIAIMRLKKSLSSVKNITLNLLAIFCMALLIYLSSDFGLMATMVNLLVVACCLKLINLQTRADYHLVLIVLFFLIACGFVYHQSIYIVAYYFACLVILFVSAFILNKGNLGIKNSISQSGKMMLQAIPITLALFVVVPRLPPFWQSNVEKSTQTGLSEEITPGDIANLAQSDELVFRAEFDTALPTPPQRYWRSIVLDYFDGKTWRVSNAEQNKALNKQQIELKNQTNSNEYFRYLVLAEPNNTKWLYSLDAPIVDQTISAQDIYQNRQYQLFQATPSDSPSMYIVRSFPDAKLDNFLPTTDFARYLQVPFESNEKTQEWVKTNIDDNMSFTEKLNIMNRFFVEQDFKYTLKPPLMLSSPVDAFLFDYQRGFCSHYASALTYMLRLANIPARMVAGYQGGQNEGDNIISVHQFDAHAWVEAYHPEKGWLRYDPTALIAPNRTLSGLLAALNEQEGRFFNEELGSWFSMPILSDIEEALAILDHNWNQMILGFNTESQSSIIEDIFGELSAKSLTTFLFIALASIIIFLALIFLPYKQWLKRDKKPSIEKVLLLLEKYQLMRNKNETLKTFISRISSELNPEFKESLLEFVDAFYQIEYEQNEDKQHEQLEVIYQRLKKHKVLLVRENPQT